jgi:DNA gyrase subunit A
VIGVEASDGSENVCLVTRSARVLVFPVDEANVVSGVAKGVTAVRLDAKDRVLGFTLAGAKGDGLEIRTSRGATQSLRASKYPVTARGGKGYAIMQRGSIAEVILPEATPVPPMDQVEQ